MYENRVAPGFSKITSADARKLRACKLLQDPSAAESGAERHATMCIVGDPADEGGIPPFGERPHGLQQSFRVFGSADADEFSLVGTVHGIQAQHVAGCTDFRSDGYGAFLEFNAEGAAFGKFIQRRRETAALSAAQSERSSPSIIPLRASITAVP